MADDAIRALGVPSTLVSAYRWHHFRQCYGIDRWYEPLAKHTFASVFVRLSFEEAEAVLRRVRRKLSEQTRAVVERAKQRTANPEGANQKHDQPMAPAKRDGDQQPDEKLLAALEGSGIVCRVDAKTSS
jgi:hypothetical protein